MGYPFQPDDPHPDHERSVYEFEIAERAAIDAAGRAIMAFKAKEWPLGPDQEWDDRAMFRIGLAAYKAALSARSLELGERA